MEELLAFLEERIKEMEELYNNSECSDVLYYEGALDAYMVTKAQVENHISKGALV